MRLTLIISFLLVSLSFFSCKKTDHAGEINRLEEQLASNANTETTTALVAAYKAFVDNNANDPAAADYLTKAADLETKSGNFDAAISLLSQSIKKYFDPEKSKNNILSLVALLAEKKNAKDNVSSFLAAFSDPAQIKDLGPNLIEECRTKSFDAATQKLDKLQANNYVNISEMVAYAFPKETAAPAQLFKAAEIASIVKKHNRALNMYDTILEQYPDYEKASQALFLKGFTLDTHQKKFDEAKVVYESFLKKYPEDKFAQSTKFLLDKLGVPDDEIIKSFEANKQ